MEHYLKIEKVYLDNLQDGRKKVEIRYNDRDYQIGDLLLFNIPDGYIKFKITHIHSGYGLKEGYVALSIKKINT